MAERLSDRDLMKLAIEEAEAAVRSGDGCPFGAVIAQDGKVVATGHNQLFKNKDPTAHGEVMAIRNACQALGVHELAGCVMYTSCYPCPMCFCACLWAKIERVYYSVTASEAPGADQEAYRIVQSQSSVDGMMEWVEMDTRMNPFKLWNAVPDKTHQFDTLK